VLLERAVLAAAEDLRRRGEPEFHGFGLASHLQDRERARRLIALGTLYKALYRMERAGLVSSRWEDPQVAADARRPRRRFYTVTPDGVRALALAQAAVPLTLTELRARLAAT
jgi:DNA-binding PadR family transcriptional regulator